MTSPRTYPEPGHTAAGAALTEFILESFRLNGALVAAGDRLARAVGLTAARWQVLSSVARAPHPGPVAHIARDMGLSRQSVQRTTDQLVAEGVLALEPNPHHKRAPRVVVSLRGREAFARITARQVPYVNELARGVSLDHIATAIGVLRRLQERLEASEVPTPGTARSRLPARRRIRTGATRARSSRT